MTSSNEKTLNARLFGDSREEGTTEHLTEGTIMKQSTPDKSFSTFDIATGHARIFVEENREYWGGDTTVPMAVRLTDDSESHMLLSPAEALSVAAALTAVAVHLMETTEARAA